jgi:hypothetical protein
LRLSENAFWVRRLLRTETGIEKEPTSCWVPIQKWIKTTYLCMSNGHARQKKEQKILNLPKYYLNKDL